MRSHHLDLDFFWIFQIFKKIIFVLFSNWVIVSSKNQHDGKLHQADKTCHPKWYGLGLCLMVIVISSFQRSLAKWDQAYKKVLSRCLNFHRFHFHLISQSLVWVHPGWWWIRRNSPLGLWRVSAWAKPWPFFLGEARLEFFIKCSKFFIMFFSNFSLVLLRKSLLIKWQKLTMQLYYSIFTQWFYAIHKKIFDFFFRFSFLSETFF